MNDTREIIEKSIYKILELMDLKKHPYKEALSALAKKAIFLKVLGSYPKARTEL